MSTDWSKLKVTDLKSELKKRGLPQGGLKAELVARLTTADTEVASDDSIQEQAEISELQVATTPEHTEAIAKPVSEHEAQPKLPHDAPAPILDSAVLANKEEDLEEVGTAVQSTREVETIADTHATIPIADGTEDTTVEPSKPAEAAEAILTPTATSSSTDATPLPPAEILQDTQKRKRRSASPIPSNAEVARKRHKLEEESQQSSNVEGEDLSQETEAANPEPVAREKGDIAPRLEVRNGRQDISELVESPLEVLREPERDVTPAVHPATSALYIKNFQRPLRPQQVQDHVLDIATPTGSSLDPSIITDFYLDTIRTHAFVAFTTISAASRVRTALHDTVWPNETNRKALWVDFVPPEKVRGWIEYEEAQGGRRGSTSRFEVFYDQGEEGSVTVTLDESGAAPPAAKQPQPPTPVESRRPSVPTGPSRPFPGVEGAPLGPRGYQAGAKVGNGSSRLEPAQGQKSTRSRPAVNYKPVPEELARRRLSNLKAVKARDPVYGKDKDYHRYFFETGDLLVNRGKEVFLGIRPPHRERERERQRDRAGTGRRFGDRVGGGGGGGGRSRRDARDNRSWGGVPRGGDRYRGAAASDSRYDDRKRSRYDSTDRYR